MDDSGNADHLQHSVPVVRHRELVVAFETPRIGSRAPAVSFVCLLFCFFFGPHIEKLHIEGTKVERLWHAPENIENDDTLNGRQVDQFAVDLQTDLALHVLAHFSTHHLPQSHFYVHALVVKSVQHNTVRQTGKMLKIRSRKVF